MRVVEGRLDHFGGVVEGVWERVQEVRESLVQEVQRMQDAQMQEVQTLVRKHKEWSAKALKDLGKSVSADQETIYRRLDTILDDLRSWTIERIQTEIEKFRSGGHNDQNKSKEDGEEEKKEKDERKRWWDWG